jgi:hypothetical protein
MRNSLHLGRSVIARLNDPTCKEAQFEACLEAINILLNAIQRLESEISSIRESGNRPGDYANFRQDFDQE